MVQHHFDACAGGGGGQPGFAVADEARIGIDADEAAIAEVIEADHADGGDLDHAGGGRGEGGEVCQPGSGGQT